MAQSGYAGKRPSKRSGCGKKRPSNTSNRTYGNRFNYNNVNQLPYNKPSQPPVPINILELCDKMDNKEEAKNTMISYLCKKQTLDPNVINNLDFKQKELLTRGIQCLDSEYFGPLINMLQTFIPDNERGNDECELHIDSIDHTLQIKMYNYMLEALQKQENQRKNKNNKNNRIKEKQSNLSGFKRKQPHSDDIQILNNKPLRKRQKLNTIDPQPPVKPPLPVQPVQPVFGDNSQNKITKLSADFTTYLNKIKTIQNGMNECVVNYETKCQELNDKNLTLIDENEKLMDEKEENVKEINNMKGIIQSNRNDQIKLIQKNNELIGKNNELIGNNNQLVVDATNLMEQKQKLEIEAKKLKLKIININKTNKELNDKNERLIDENEKLNGKSKKIDVLSIEELDALAATLNNGSKVIKQAKNRKIIDKTKCIICWKNDKSILINECSCFVLCNECYEKLEKTICPKCQNSFRYVTHVRL